MGAMRGFNPVKLFVGVVPLSEERLTSEYGPIDHRSSLIPTDGAIHRVFFSFERLVETSQLSNVKRFPAAVHIGFVDNRRAVVARTTNDSHRFELGNNVFGEETLQFKNGGVQSLPWTPIDFQSDACHQFFLIMRKLYRDQLRSMCLLRR